jgi:hypothetical protein
MRQAATSLLAEQVRRKKLISIGRVGTIAQVTTALDAAQRAAEAELAVNEVGLVKSL